MNEALENILTRRSIRAFKSDPIPKDVLEQIINAGLYAPMARSKYAPIIIAVTNKELRDKLSKLNAEIYGKDLAMDPFYGAPVVLIVLAQKDAPTHIYDGSLVMGNLMLAAHSLGIGSCWIHRARQEFERPEGQAILKQLGVEGEYEGIGHCVLGYVKGDYPQAKPRTPGRVYHLD